MKDEEMAEKYAICRTYPKFETDYIANFVLREVEGAFLAGLKAGRPQWHDLRENPNDLPPLDTKVLCWEQCGSTFPVVAKRHIFKEWGRTEWEWECYWGSGYELPQNGVYAWKEIVPPEFPKESENYTVEQNAGENQIEGGVISISGSVSMYRPFNDCDELVECWEKKMLIPAVMFTKDERDKLYRPSIWVKSKEYGTDNLIIAFDNDNESIGGSCVFIQDIWVDMKELFDNFTFLDGSPCGVEE